MLLISLTADRRELVAAITKITGEKMKYQGPPTFQYVLGDFVVERDGNLQVANVEKNREVLRVLSKSNLIDYSLEGEEQAISIELPLEAHTGLSLQNLMKILWTKQEIINKAIGRFQAFKISERFLEALEESPPEEVKAFLLLWERMGGEETTKGLTFTSEKVGFTGFPFTEDSDWIRAYMDLASKIVQESLLASRIELKKLVIENEKYYFRSWVIRIGLGGEAYKETRKLLLSNLTGHSAFRTQEQKEQHRSKYLKAREKEKALVNETP